jgi:hypothetical protein
MPISNWEPIVCELANGNSIKIEGGVWANRRTITDFPPSPCVSIRIYCTEDTLPMRLACVAEYIEGEDFPSFCTEAIWQWLSQFCGGREIFDFDCLDEFLEHVEEAITDIATPEPDAVEHIKDLPKLSWPECFDQVDDSIYNDQNDAECGP